jgi:hypothetical protein
MHDIPLNEDQRVACRMQGASVFTLTVTAIVIKHLFKNSEISQEA